MTAHLTGHGAGTLQRAAALTLAARTDLETQLQQLTGGLAFAPSQWDGAGARAFQTAFSAWSEQQRRVLADLQWLHDQLLAVDRHDTATDEALAATFGGAA